MNTRFTLILIYAFVAIIVSSCALDPHRGAWVSPKEGIFFNAKAETNPELPIYLLGSELNRSFEVLGHISISNNGLMADNLPLNFKGEIPAKAKERIRELASKLSADAVVSITQSGYSGWIYAGQYIDGLAVKFTRNSTNFKGFNERQEFITCLLPVILPETKNEDVKGLDEDIRRTATYFLKSRGYYVLTPARADIRGAAPSFESLNESELINLCDHKVDFFLVLKLITETIPESEISNDSKGGSKSSERKRLVISIFSVKDNEFIISDSRIKESGKLVAAGFISGGLIGAAISAAFDSSAASERMVIDALNSANVIELLPDIGMPVCPYHC